MLKLLKQNKTFRTYVAYQFFSSIGAAMFAMFILLAIHLMYRNPVYTGIAGFLMAAPRIISFAVGPIVDRRSKVKIMRGTTFIEFAVLSTLAFTPMQEQFGVIFVFIIVFIFNIATLFENPAATAFLPQIMHENDILQANALINMVSIAGGLIIGVVLFSSLGGDVNFAFLYGISAVLLGFTFIFSLFLRAPKASETPDADAKKVQKEKPNYIQDLKQGMKFIKGSFLKFFFIASMAVDFVTEMAYVNRPMFLEYHAGAQGYVLFVLITLLGSFVASYIAGKLGNKFKVGKVVFALIILAGFTRVFFALIVPVQIIAGLITVAVYAALIVAADIIMSSLNQKVPPKDMVGRVSTISSTFGAVAVALGAFLGGIAGSAVSDISHIFIYQGISLVVVAVVMILIPSIGKLPKMNEISKSEESEDVGGAV